MVEGGMGWEVRGAGKTRQESKGQRKMEPKSSVV